MEYCYPVWGGNDSAALGLFDRAQVIFYTLLTNTGHYWSISRVSTSPTATDGQGTN